MNLGYILLPVTFLLGVGLVYYSRSITDWNNRLRELCPRWVLVLEPQPRSSVMLIVVGSFFAVVSFLGILALLLDRAQAVGLG